MVTGVTEDQTSYLLGSLNYYSAKCSGGCMKSSAKKLHWILFLMAFLAIGLQSPAKAATDLTIYAEALDSGWQNWSWDTTVNTAATTPVHAGSRSMAVTYRAGWAGLYIHANSAVALSGYDHLSFWINGGSGNQQLRVVANGDGDNAVSVTAQAGTWVKIDISLAALGSPTTLSEIYWQDTTGGTQPVFYLDDIILVASTGPPPPPPPPGTGPALTINTGAGRHSISEDIYGMNYADEQLASDLRLPVRRWGGNSTSRYNWQADVHNTGSDWYFENIPEDNSNPAALPNGSAADRFVEQDRRTGTNTLMTVPLIGWTPKRRLSSHPYDCGFKMSKYGAQQSTDSWDTDCGNGINTSGSDITGNDPTDTSTAITPAFVTAWINHLTGRYGTAAAGGVPYYNLDNEPMLWNSTHRDVHPQPTTYDEMLDRTTNYASAVKAADPSARTLGPVLWGWCAYFYSAADNCGIGSDYTSHGNLPFVVWYLQQMKAYETQHGTRILDYLDLHHYPQANGVSLGSAGSSSTQALRLRSTRSLWDPAYKDESWISTMESGGVAVKMIPRMKAWVNENYPGTKTAITEYNWGALDNINGALAQADVLGIFGREGLDLATLWGPPDSSDPGAYAFRMYRNYDGSAHGFGDISVQATSADQDAISVYAAERTSDHALTILVINKTGNALTSSLSLTGIAPSATAQVFRYSTASPAAIEHLSDQAIADSGFSATFAANSLTLFVVSGGIKSPNDFEGSGKSSITVYRPDSGVWYSLSNITPGNYSSTQWGLPADKPVPGDYDGDGKTDIAVWRPDTGTWFTRSSRTAGTYTSTQWGLPVDKPVPADYDGDGKTDIAVWRPGTGVWYILLSSTPGSYNSIQWGLSGDIPASADYDSDGKANTAVFRPSSGTWYVLLSVSSGTYTSIHWGMPEDIPVPGDYDGDGKADIVVWRPSSGTWYVLPSASPGTYIGTQWGITSDKPVSGDYDGDGKADIAVWRPSAGTWYILLSGTPGSYIGTAWGLSSDMPISSLTTILNARP
jgi:hypothetical protein